MVLLFSAHILIPNAKKTTHADNMKSARQICQLNAQNGYLVYYDRRAR